MISKTETFAVLKEAIDKKEPFLATRCGDGESILLAANDWNRIGYIFKRQIGYIPDIKDIEKIKQEVISAYESSDMIGVPTLKHNVVSKDWACVVKRLDRLSTLKGKLLASIDFHTDLMDYYENLFQGQDIIIISGRDIKEGFIKKYEPNSLKLIQITPEVKFEGKKYEKKHYPEQYNEVQEWLGKEDLRGKVVIYGAGFVGKVYGKTAKESGAVAIDLGSVFDLWAGRVTRGPKKGIDIIDDKFKL